VITSTKNIYAVSSVVLMLTLIVLGFSLVSNVSWEKRIESSRMKKIKYPCKCSSF